MIFERIKSFPVPLRKVVLEEFKDFCANSTVNGIRYVTEPGRHWTERFKQNDDKIFFSFNFYHGFLNRIWWVIALASAFLLCGRSIGGIWMDWHQNPVTFQQQSTLISEIPFPALSICPQAKAYAHKLKFRSLIDSMLKISKVNISNAE